VYCVLETKSQHHIPKASSTTLRHTGNRYRPHLVSGWFAHEIDGCEDRHSGQDNSENPCTEIGEMILSYRFFWKKLL